MESPRTAHKTLAATLRQLRIDAGLSQTAAAKAAGVTQTKISRLEHGRHTPNPDDVERLAAAYRAPAKVRRELRRAAQDLVEGRVYSRIVLQRGAWHMQERTGRIEADSARIRTFEPTLVPGLLQTRAYATVMFASVGITGPDLDRTVQARLDRQRLLDSGREFVQIITEGALRWQVDNPGLMVEQLEHIIEVAAMPNVRVGIIPHTTPAQVFPQEGFNMYDTRAVIIGTTTATATITDSGDLGVYDKLFGEFEVLASFGADAVRELDRIAADYRALS